MKDGQILDVAEENDFEVAIEVFHKGPDMAVEESKWPQRWAIWENFSKVQRLLVEHNIWHILLKKQDLIEKKESNFWVNLIKIFVPLFICDNKVDIIVHVWQGRSVQNNRQWHDVCK